MKALIALVIASTVALPAAGIAPLADAGPLTDTGAYADAWHQVFALTGQTPPAETTAGIDALPPEVRDALDDVLRAYLDYQGKADGIAALHVFGPLPAEDAPWQDIAPLRERLRDAGLALRDAVAASEVPTALPAGGPTDPVQVELGCDADPDDTYTADAVLIIDLCGNDTYQNNAGGTVSVAPGPTRCDRITVAPNVHVAATVSAAVIDGDGSDRYTPADASCGVNGGGALGAGFLMDVTGDDLYAAGSIAVNGGGHLGSGFLLDLAGNDTYQAVDQGVNGGGYVAGHGALTDVAGDDTYTVAPGATRGVNGGGYFAAVGFLADLETDEDFHDGEAVLDCGDPVCVMAVNPPLADAYGTRIDLA